MAKCVLVVDDSETVRQVLQLTLSNAGFDVIEAEDGDDALNKLSNAPVVDMLITDLNMPNMDGLELIKKIRAEKKHRFTPIVMLTTESSEEKKRAGREAGASGWIVKPFKPEQLLKVVKMVLGD
ncbi:MAG: response regulator [Desulfuromonadales bacterium]|jgi:two-component system chemotaxis response regulator CheY